MSETVLPNFLIIGAPRSATTLLEKCCAEHPDVFVAGRDPHIPGDIHFFDVSTEVSYERNFEKGIRWYESLFEGAAGATAVGEKTAHYLVDPEAPRLIHAHLPAVKLIAILRNPVDRAYSDYWYHRGEIPGGMSFLEACHSPRASRLLLLEAGRYYEQIQRYLELFERAQFLFLIYEDLKSDPLGAIQSAFRFIGVRSEFIPSRYGQRVNVAVAQSGLSLGLRRLGGRVKLHFPRTFQRIRAWPLAHRVEKRISRDSSTASVSKTYPPLPRRDRKVLSEYYALQNRQLSELLRRDLTRLWQA